MVTGFEEEGENFWWVVRSTDGSRACRPFPQENYLGCKVTNFHIYNHCVRVGAACVPSGHGPDECMMLTQEEAEEMGAEWLGYDTDCGPADPCQTSPARQLSWGTIKGLYEPRD